MKKTNGHDQKTFPTGIFSIISLDTGIFGWFLAFFILETSFTSLSTYFPFGQIAGWFVLASPGISWLTALVTGAIAMRQLKRKGSQEKLGLAKWGIGISGVGCALFYGLLLLAVIGFAMAFSRF